MDTKLWEEKLKQALIISQQREIDLLEESALKGKDAYKFSKEFENKMQTLIDSLNNKENNKNNENSNKIVNLKPRKLSINKKALIVVAAIVLIMSMVLTVEGNKETIAKMFMEITQKFKNITFQKEEGLISSIREEYIPSYIPKDYTLISENTMNSIRKVIYKNEKDIELEFIQAIPNGTKIGLENEDILEKSIKIKNKDGTLIENIDSQRKILYWYDERYALIIIGEVPEYEMTFIAESVKIKEK